MTDISPFSVKFMPLERALALPPGIELDMYVMANVLEGPDETIEIKNLGRLPGFSRKFADCKMLLIMATQELGRLGIDCDPNHFAEAVDKGFIIRKRPCIVWRIDTKDNIAFGRTFEESLCKLLILVKCGGSDAS